MSAPGSAEALIDMVARCYELDEQAVRALPIKAFRDAIEHIERENDLGNP